MRRPVAAAAAFAAGVAIITACGSDDNGTPDVATVAPATPSEAPAASNPAGSTVPAPAGARALASSGSTVAVLSPDGNQVLRYDAASITAPVLASSSTVTVTLFCRRYPVIVPGPPSRPSLLYSG